MQAHHQPYRVRSAGRMTAPALLSLFVFMGCPQTPEQQAVRAVERLGGKLKFAGQDADRAVTEVDLSRTLVADADLEQLRPFARLQALNLSGTAITDRGLAVLRDFGSLKKLNLTLTKISDAGLTSLAGLPELEELYLVETGITDAGVAELKRLAHLRMLVLLRTAISAAAVDEVRRALPGARIQIEPRRSAGS